ncbi:MAG: hypothetical protein U0936_23030 [Planctomycetaceae bacterium]
MISQLNMVINGLFDLLLRPFMMQSAWPGMLFASFVTAIVLVVLFHFSSDPNEIRRTRNRLLARTLELLMFQHDLRASFSACGRILLANGAYLIQFLRPMVVGLIPLILLFAQLESWFDRRPLRIGEQAVLTVGLDPSHSVLSHSAELQFADNLKVDPLPVRVPSRNELGWRITATGHGEGWIDITLGDKTERKSLSSVDHLTRLSQARVVPGVLSQLLSPSETPLDVQGPFRTIHVSYPRREMFIGQTEIPWIVAAVGLMMIFSLILGRLFGIRVV